jgi:hypothetical protein
MSTMGSPDISDVLELVRTWTPAMRATLARKVLETLGSAVISEPQRAMPFDDVVGLLKSDVPPPNDEECARIIEQERARKYG